MICFFHDFTFCFVLDRNTFNGSISTNSNNFSFCNQIYFSFIGKIHDLLYGIQMTSE